MKTLTVKEFCDKHDACEGGRKWAVANCSSMQEAWEESPDPSWVVWMATRPRVLTHKELILFAVFCARQNEHLLTDQRGKDAITIAEKFANGEATQEEATRAASDAAWAASDAAWAAWDAASDAARAAWAASEAARAAASDAARATRAARAAWAAASDAARSAARAAARAARDAASDAARAARDAIQKKQAEYLRRFTLPNFMP